MGVNRKHPDYEERELEWRMVRDALEGQRAVKAGGINYLPPPPGMEATGFGDVLESGKRAPSTRYDFYLSFAEFPEVIDPALSGFQGIMHSKPPTVKLPPQMEYLLEDATPQGATLEELWFAITREVLTGGRVNILIDVNPADDTLTLVPYSVENMTNWRERTRREGGGAEFVVLREMLREADEDDEFNTKEAVLYRELRMRGSARDEASGDLTGPVVYQQRAWRAQLNQDGDEKDPDVVMTPGSDSEGWVTPSRLGKKFEQVPIVPINALDVGFTYGAIPMMPLTRRAMSIYKLTADYRRALYVKGDPQVVLSGVADEDVPEEIGGESVWNFPNPQASASYLDIDGQGIPLMRLAIQDEFERFDAEGGRMMRAENNGPESGVAIKRRMQSQQVTLRNVVVNAGSALQQILRWIAKVVGADPMLIVFSPDLDFAEPTMIGADLREFQQSRKDGAPMSARSLHELMRRGGATSMDFDEELAAIKEDMQAMAAITAEVNAFSMANDPLMSRLGGDGKPGDEDGEGDDDDDDDDDSDEDDNSGDSEEQDG